MQITTRTELEAEIVRLNILRKEQEAEMGEQVKIIAESIKPSNLIKHAIHSVTQPGDIRSAILKGVGGIATGFLAKGMLGGKAKSAVGSLLGNVLKIGATSAFYKNLDKIKAYGTAIYHNVIKKDK